MATEACRITDLDAFADLVTGPCCATIYIEGLLASIEGDVVSGDTLVGAVIEGSPTVYFEGLPANRVTSVVEGANVETGATVATVMASGATTVFIE